MKTLRMSLMLFLIVLVSSSKNANGNTKVSVVPGEQEKLIVDVVDVPYSTFSVKLTDSDGQVIYSDVGESSSIDNRTAYNLSDLQDGKYTLEVQHGNQTEFTDLVINNDKVEILDQENQMSPTFSLDGKYLEFSFPNVALNNARLLLYDNINHEWIYQESLKQEYNIKQDLNLSALHPGSYKAVLISGDGVYDYNFELS